MDYILRGMARNNNIRVIGCDCVETVNTICKQHQTYPIATIALSRLICAAVMMGKMLKDKQTITCILNGNGELGTIFAQANAKGETRGFVANPYVDLPLLNNKWDVETAIGSQGDFTVTKSFENNKNFSSKVEIKNGDIANTIAEYFYYSEQIPTIINLKVTLDKEGNVSVCRGYIIQLITGYSEEDLKFLENLKVSSLEENIEVSLEKMFDDLEILEKGIVAFKCDCNKEKFINGLKSLNKEELTKIIEEDKNIEVVCNFCSQKYYFYEEELKEMCK